MRSTTGVQSLDRAFMLLQHIGQSEHAGLEQNALQQITGLDRTTVHRMLTFLERNQYIARDHDEHARWRLGMRSMQLGMQAMSRPALVEQLRPQMKSLARRTQDNVFLVCRMSDYSLTLHLEQGDLAIPSYQSLVGATRLLGLGTASVALLASLSDTMLQAHLQRHQATYTANYFGPLKIQRAIQRTRQFGYTLASDPAVSGAGVAFEVQGFGPVAISVLSSRARMPVVRRHAVANMIMDEVRAI